MQIALYEYKTTRSRPGPPITALIPAHPYLISVINKSIIIFPDLNSLWSRVTAACAGLGRYGTRVHNIRELATEIDAPDLQRLLGHKRQATTLHGMANAITPTHRTASKRLRF